MAQSLMGNLFCRLIPLYDTPDEEKTPHNIHINDMKLILNTYVAFVVNK